MIQPVHPKGNHSWIFIGKTDAEDEAPKLWPPDSKNWFLGKDPDSGKEWRQEEKGMTEDEMFGWHHRCDVHEFEQALGFGDGQWSLLYSSPWGRKQLDMTEGLNWTKTLNYLTQVNHSNQFLLSQVKVQRVEQILQVPWSRPLKSWSKWKCPNQSLIFSHRVIDQVRRYTSILRVDPKMKHLSCSCSLCFEVKRTINPKSRLSVLSVPVSVFNSFMLKKRERENEANYWNLAHFTGVLKK